MAERTVALMGEHRDGRAALVVGGFHVRSVIEQSRVVVGVLLRSS